MAKKKEKVTYIDDGRSFADLSDVKGGIRLPKRPTGVPRASAKEQWETYKAAVKMMFTPMLVIVVGLVIIYMILSVIFLLL